MNKYENEDLKVIARAPFHIYYEGAAKVVSASNPVGKFDILPGHADFFSVLSPGSILIETEAESVNFKIGNGIITVRDNEVMLFVNMWLLHNYVVKRVATRPQRTNHNTKPSRCPIYIEAARTAADGRNHNVG